MLARDARLEGPVIKFSSCFGAACLFDLVRTLRLSRQPQVNVSCMHT